MVSAWHEIIFNRVSSSRCEKLLHEHLTDAMSVGIQFRPSPFYEVLEPVQRPLEMPGKSDNGKRNKMYYQYAANKADLSSWQLFRIIGTPSR